ncbi:Copine-7, partial [Camelus dromedarius]
PSPALPAGGSRRRLRALRAGRSAFSVNISRETRGFTSKEQEIGARAEVDRTEVVRSSLHLVFPKAFTLGYCFEEVQKLRSEVYDAHGPSSLSCRGDNFLGGVECTLGQIVAQKKVTRVLLLKFGRKAGKSTITETAEDISGNKGCVELSFRARKLDDKSWENQGEAFRPPLPLGVDAGHWHCGVGPLPVPVPQAQRDCVNAKYKQRRQLQELWGGGPGRPGGPRSPGSPGLGQPSWKFFRVCSSLDCIMGGCQIHFTAAIDFIASNGDPRNSCSLHYINPFQPNEYLQALVAVGEICQDYNSVSPVCPPPTRVSHDFAINFNPKDDECEGRTGAPRGQAHPPPPAGIQGVVEAYQNCLPGVQLYGPANVAPIISKVARRATAEPHTQEGSVDGVVTNIVDTWEATVRTSHLPMPILILGVGNTDFTNTQLLDGDGDVLRSPRGEPALRDIVQFVPFQEFRHPLWSHFARQCREQAHLATS